MFKVYFRIANECTPISLCISVEDTERNHRLHDELCKLMSIPLNALCSYFNAEMPKGDGLWPSRNMVVLPCETLYQAIVEKQIPHSHHCSDLYIDATNENRHLLQAYGVRFAAFTDQITGKVCYEIPFAYEPFWNKETAVSSQE